MTQLLIVSTSILAIGPVLDVGDSLQTPDIIYAKSLIPGYQIVDATLPSGFSIQDYEWVSGNLHLKPSENPNSTDPANAPLIAQSYNSALRRRAEVLQQQGNTFEAVQLLLQAQGIQS